MLCWDDLCSEFAQFGPNAEVTIEIGSMNRHVGCAAFGHEEFIDDTFLLFTDVYVVPHGNHAVGEQLTDVSGQPNAVQGASDGSFVGATIGFTAPSGDIGTGMYDVIYDECQDGFLDVIDAVFHFSGVCGRGYFTRCSPSPVDRSAQGGG